MGYIDLHCDTLMEFCDDSKENSLFANDKQVDLLKLQAGGALAQFFAVFPPDDSFYEWKKWKPLSLEKYISRLYEGFLGELAKYSERVRFAKSYKDYMENKKEGIISAFLTLEDGKAVYGSIERLEQFYNDGFRLITLTWNHENCFGYPNSKDINVMGAGLKRFGIEAVERMNELGMIIDVSHLSDGGFFDVAKYSKKPFTASHSNARTICPHTRNLTDEMIKVISKHGGIIGINFGPDFIDWNVDKKESSITHILAHIRYMKKIGGIECIALGTDFDGIMGKQQIKDASKMPLLFEALEEASFTQTEIAKITHQNAERFLSDTL